MLIYGSAGEGEARREGVGGGRGGGGREEVRERRFVERILEWRLRIEYLQVG